MGMWLFFGKLGAIKIGVSLNKVNLFTTVDRPIKVNTNTLNEVGFPVWGAANL